MNYYEVVGVPTDATTEQIRAARKRAAARGRARQDRETHGDDAADVAGDSRRRGAARGSGTRGR